MSGFKPFSLADAIKDGQGIKLNRMKLQSMQTEMDRQRGLKEMATSSTKPVYGEAAGPAEEGQRRPEIQTGTEYDPDAHQQKLQQAGEMELASNLTKHMNSMDEGKRDEFTFKTQEAAKQAIVADTPEKWEEMMDEAVQSGEIEKALPFEARDKIITMGRKVEDILKTDKSGIWGKVNPKDYTEESIDKFSVSKNYSDLVPLDKTGGTGSSEFERLSKKLAKDGLTESEQSRYDVLAGMKARPSPTPFKTVDVEGKMQVFDKTSGNYIFDEDARLSGSQVRAKMSDAQKKSAIHQKRTDSMRGEANKGTEHFQTQRTRINDALAAMGAGENGVADALLGQVMSQVQDSNVRAFQMYSVFDSSYGNAAERVGNAISRFMTGTRSDSERKQIKDTLLSFKKYSDPAANRMRNKYRSLARDNGLRPFQVVPPDSPEDIKNAPGISKENKMKALEMYYPEMF